MDRRIFDMMNIYNEFGEKTTKPSECYYNGDYCVPSPKDFLDGTLTMAFVNMQPIESVYDTETAFNNGSLFPNIDKPLYMYGGKYK